MRKFSGEVQSSGGGAVLDVGDLCVWYRSGSGWRAAVKDVSLTLGRGEAVGLVGESGSGKSSVAMAILRYLPPGGTSSAARLSFEGRDLAGMSFAELRAIRGARISAVYQHPGAALNPTLKVGRQIAEVMQEHRPLSDADASERAVELLDRMRVREPRAVLDRYPHQLSGGMQQRVTIAMAIALEPSLLVLDEPTTALDATVQAEIIAILRDLRRDHDMSLLLISHHIGLVRRVVDRTLVMREGEIVEQGNVEKVFTSPEHPYTRELLASVGRHGLRKQDGSLFSSRASSGTAVRLRGVAKTVGVHRLLRDINLDIPAGTTFGLIGESGSGKSTLAKLVTGLQRPSAGVVELFGRPVSSLLERRAREERRAVQMVFQSPDMTLNPRHRLRRILALPLRRLARLRGAAVGQRAAELLEAVRLPAELAASRPRALSGGQRQRVAIARAFAGSPRIVVLDEPTSALDVSVQASILDLLNELQRDSGSTYLFISHDLDVVRYMADHIGVLYRGQLVETGPADRVFAGPNHPYTKMLLTSAFEGEPRTDAVPASLNAERDTDAHLCPFAARCPVAMSRCLESSPPERLYGAEHRVACWREP